MKRSQYGFLCWWLTILTLSISCYYCCSHYSVYMDNCWTFCSRGIVDWFVAVVCSKAWKLLNFSNNWTSHIWGQGIQCILNFCVWNTIENCWYLLRLVLRNKCITLHNTCVTLQIKYIQTEWMLSGLCIESVYNFIGVTGPTSRLVQSLWTSIRFYMEWQDLEQSILLGWPYCGWVWDHISKSALLKSVC